MELHTVSGSDLIKGLFLSKVFVFYIHQTKLKDYVRCQLNGHNVNMLFLGMHVFFLYTLLWSIKTQTFITEVMSYCKSLLVSFYTSYLMSILFILKAKQKQKQVCLPLCSHLYNFLRTSSIILLHSVHLSTLSWLCTLPVTCRANISHSVECAS